MNRRLRILPEVLPAPTRAPAQTNVRARTVAHMQRLLATAAVLPLGCTKADTQPTQTVTIPASSGSAAGGGDTNKVSLIPETHPSATATATATAPVDVGYAVVDPMPAPARCMGLAAASNATATFTSDASGPVLEVRLTLPTGGAWSGTTFASPGAPSVWGGQIISSSLGAGGMSQIVRVRPSPGATSSVLGVTFSISCTAGAGSIAVTASFSSTTKGSKVALAKNDY